VQVKTTTGETPAHVRSGHRYRYRYAYRYRYRV